jgi:hypothetical protein
MAVTKSDKPIPTEEGHASDGLTFNQVFAIFQENDRVMEEASRKMNMLTEQMGNLCRNFGEMTEHIVAQNIKERVKV